MVPSRWTPKPAIDGHLSCPRMAGFELSTEDRGSLGSTGYSQSRGRGNHSHPEHLSAPVRLTPAEPACMDRPRSAWPRLCATLIVVQVLANCSRSAFCRRQRIVTWDVFASSIGSIGSHYSCPTMESAVRDPKNWTGGCPSLPRILVCHVCGGSVIIPSSALTLTLDSASCVKIWSVSFSSSRVRSNKSATRSRPNLLAHARREPYAAIS